MSERKLTASEQFSAIRALRLDAWRVPGPDLGDRSFGSLAPVLAEFAPRRMAAVVPAQRETPEVPDWLRRTG